MRHDELHDGFAEGWDDAFDHASATGPRYSGSEDLVASPLVDRQLPSKVRPRPTAPVATPLRWEELSEQRLTPDRWMVATVGRRLADGGDPWDSIAATR
jgi:hypothetical protein